ncbi:MAG: FAD-dependent tricarballylate dehydrogenase TcuA [Gammaproteobacteria bacterium]
MTPAGAGVPERAPDGQPWDVLIAGAGNAGLSAAMTASEAGASVLVLESAPRHMRGGNSRHTRNLRCMHEEPTDVLTQAYPEQEYLEDLMRVTGGKTDEALARLTIRESANCARWMVERGVRFQPALGGTLHLGRTNAFFLGGGKALMNAYCRTAESAGVHIRYDAQVESLDIHDGYFKCARVRVGDDAHEVCAKCFVAAAGGFESNIEWLKEGWGEAAQNFRIRGTPYNTGRVLRALLDSGVKQVGDPAQCHAVAVDGRAPRFDGGIVTRVDCVVLGIVVNSSAERFYDEGEDFWPKRYAIWGRLVAQQANQVGYVLIDDKAIGLFMPPVFPPEQADSIAELAGKIGLDPVALTRTVAEFNAACRGSAFDRNALDECHTEGLALPKSHWARPLDTPPYRAYSLSPGITFTYLGVGVNERARILMDDGRPSANMYAAGEIMAGNVLGQGYLAGIGMTIGTVFGRIAGQEAAHRARN